MVERIAERFFSHVAQAGDCWEWTAGRTTTNYGKAKIAGRTWLAHRWAYEYLRAEIPEGLHIDHLCRNTLCVNPWHLEPVTPKVNTQRGNVSASRKRRADETTHCARGHAYEGYNLIQTPKQRVCRECSNANGRAYRARRAAARAGQLPPPRP